MSVLLMGLVTPGEAAGSEAARVVKGIAWEMVSTDVRAALGALLGGAVDEGQSEAGGEAGLAGRRPWVDGSGDPREWPEDRATLIERLDARRAVTLDVRHTRSARSAALQDLAAVSLELYRRDCCGREVPDPWSPALAELGGEDLDGRIDSVLERQPALRDLGSATFPGAAEAAGGEVPACRSGQSRTGCAAEDLALAGFRLALLLEEALSSCRSEPGGEVVCLPYTGRSTGSCLRALPLGWN